MPTEVTLFAVLKPGCEGPTTRCTPEFPTTFWRHTGAPERTTLADLAQRASRLPHLVECADFDAAITSLDREPQTSAGSSSSANVVDHFERETSGRWDLRVANAGQGARERDATGPCKTVSRSNAEATTDE